MSTPPTPTTTITRAAEMRDLQDAAAYITPIGQDQSGNFIYSEEDEAILSKLEEERIRIELAKADETKAGQGLGGDDDQRHHRQLFPSHRLSLTRVWKRFLSTTQLQQHQTQQTEPKDEEAMVEGDVANSVDAGKRDRRRNLHRCGGGSKRGFSVGMVILGTAVLLILLLVVMVVLVLKLSSPSAKSPSHVDKTNNASGGDNENQNEHHFEENEKEAPREIELSTNSNTYDYLTDDIVVQFSKRTTYEHDFIGIYSLVPHEGDEEENKDEEMQNRQDEPLLSLRCCGSQDCFQASELTGAVRFSATAMADRLQSWPLPTGQYHARLYQIRDGERRSTFLAQTSEPFQVMGAPTDPGMVVPTPAKPPSFTVSPPTTVAAARVYLPDGASEVELIGEESDRFEIRVERTSNETDVPAFGDDWIGIYRTNGNHGDNYYLEDVEPDLWLYTCGTRNCFEHDASSVKETAVSFRLNTLQNQLWPLPWGTYQVMLRREYGSVLTVSKASLLVVYPGGETARVYPDKDEYKLGETIAVFFNDGMRDLPGVYGATGQRGGGGQAGRGVRGGGGGGGGGRGGGKGADFQPLEWAAIYRETDSVTFDAPLVFLYTCLPPKDCTGLKAVPYQGRILFESGVDKNPVALSSYGTWPLPVGRYKAALNRGQFPPEFLSGNTTGLVTAVSSIAMSPKFFHVAVDAV